MKKILAFAIAFVLTMCVLCPGALAALDPSDFVGTWYMLVKSLTDGTLLNGEDYLKGVTFVLFEDYTGFEYESAWGDEAITWGLGTGHYQGWIWILDSCGYGYFKSVDGYLLADGSEDLRLGKDLPPAGGHYRTDATLADFNGSWVVDYVLFLGMRMPFEEYLASYGGFNDNSVVMNAVTIDNGKLSDTKSEGSQLFEGDVSLSKLTLERINADRSPDTMGRSPDTMGRSPDTMDRSTDTMLFSLHEDGSMRYKAGQVILYYRRADTTEPTLETTLEPTTEPTTEPTAEPTPETTQVPETPPEEAPLPSEDPELTPANNDGGSGAPEWLIIALIALAVVAAGVIVTCIIVWFKKD